MITIVEKTQRLPAGPLTPTLSPSAGRGSSLDHQEDLS